MKEAVVHEDGSIKIIDSVVPKPGPGQVVTKVVVSGSNPKDWKLPIMAGRPLNEGDDIAGTVHAVGEGVTEFKAGDRVAAFHEMGTSGGSYAEYALSWAYTTFHIPEKTSFEEAATIPLAAMTAAVGLYARLKLPAPWTGSLEPTPLIIYGGATAVGAFAIKLAQLSNIHPIITVAGNGKNFVEGLIDRSKGDTIIDYRNGDDATVSGIEDALKAVGVAKVVYAFDTVAEKGSYHNIGRVLDPAGQIAMVLPPKQEDPPAVKWSFTAVGSVHQDVAADSPEGKVGLKLGGKDLGFVYYRFFGRGLQEGWFSGHPYEVVPGGLNGIEGALKNLKAGKASAIKYVFRIADTQ